MAHFLVGILVGVCIAKWIIPIIDISFEVYGAKKAIKATQYTLDAQERAINFYRKYPEAKEDSETELMPAIGYNINNCNIDEDDSSCKRKIGF